MSTRYILVPTLITAFAVGNPSTGFADDERLTHEEAETAVTELVDAVSQDYECKIVVSSVKAIPPSDGATGDYFVSFNASGLRCDQAHIALNDRGKSKRLVFLKKTPSRDNTEPFEEPILDLIHEIDPPVDN